MNRAKKYLIRYSVAKKQADRIALQLIELRDQATQLSQQLSADRVQTTPVPDKIGIVVSKMADKETELLIARADAIDTLIETYSIINKVSDPTCQLLLQMRYIHEQKWQDIADSLHYSYRGVLFVHKRALKQVEELI